VPARSQLQEELKQIRPWRSPSEEGAVAILKTADALRRFYTDVLRRFGVTPAQFNVLRIVRGAGPDGIATLDVASRLIERAPGITLMMDRLVKKGWLHRQRAERDRRQVRCRLTASGAKLLTAIDPAIDRADARALASLTRTNQRALVDFLAAIRRDHDALNFPESHSVRPKGAKHAHRRNR
jgi:DNA-binding MarR family transcriptional regulator